MRNMIRTALIVGTLATPMIALADTPAKKEPAAKAEPKKEEAPKADAAKKEEAPKADAKKEEHKDAKKDVKAPATK